MRDVAEWIRGTLASRREAKQPPPANAVLGAALNNVIAERANHGLLVAAHGTERLIDDDGPPIHVLEDEPAAAILFVGSTTEPGPAPALLASGLDFPPVPFAEDGIFTVDAESGTVLETLPFAGQRRGPRINGDAIQFLAMLSRELRSPLTAIQNAVRLLSSQTGEISSRQRTQVLIERQVRRMTRLVDDLLDASRISRAEKRVYRSSAEESP